MPNEVNPIDPMNPTGDGKSPAERMKRGMPNVDPAVQKDFAERLQKYIDQGKEERAARNEYKKVEANTRVGGVGGGGGGMGGNKLSNRDLTKAYKKGGKVQKFNDGGMSLEEMYPGAKITRAGAQPPPEEGGKGSEQHIRNLEALRYKRGNANAKPELFEEPKGKGKTGGGGGGIPKLNRDLTKAYKKGGSVSSASKRADGCCIKGKTKGKIV